MVGGGVLLFERALGLLRWLAVVLAFAISSVLFSAAHHVIGGEPFRVGAFTYRILCGLVFAYLGPQPAPLLPRWDVLVRDKGLEESFIDLFGDYTRNYGEALQTHYTQGDPANWQENFVSGYAASHPWEDFAETWAHYFHMIDTLETAHVAGLAVSPKLPESPGAVFDFNPRDTDLNRLIEAWLALAFAVGVYLPISTSAPVYVGGMVRWLVDRYTQRKHAGAELTEDQLVAEGDKSNGVLLSSGYIAGGTLAGAWCLNHQATLPTAKSPAKLNAATAPPTRSVSWGWGDTGERAGRCWTEESQRRGTIEANLDQLKVGHTAQTLPPTCLTPAVLPSA